MANAAAKKAAKIGDVTFKKYLPFIIFSSLLYIGIRLIWGYQNATIWHYLYLVIYSLIYLITQYGLVQSAKDNIQGEMYFDAFCVNFLSEVVASFTNWGRSILLLIPAYLCYIGITWYLKNRKSTPASISEPNNDDVSSHSVTEKKGRSKMSRR